MAEKIFNTRIKLRIDSLENWNNSTATLLPGEIAFASVAANEGLGLTEPVIMAKIATEEGKTFAQLPWAFHAKASDVLAACKSESALTAFVNNVITNAGIATNEALSTLVGKVTTAEGKITTLEGEMDAVEAKAAANETAIGVLNGLVGDTKVADQIQAAITALKLGETYAAKSLETTVANHVADTVAHVTADDKIAWNNALQSENISTGSANGTIAVKGNDVAVKGLGSAAYTDASAYDAAGSASAAETAAKAYADSLAGNYDAAGSAAAAETAAKGYADSLAGNYDVSGAAAGALEDAKGYTDEQIAAIGGDEGTISAQIQSALATANLAQYETKTDASSKLTEAKNYATGLNTAMNTRVEALEAIDHDHANKAELDKIADGDVAKWNAAEQNAKDYADGLDGAMDERVKALEGKFGEGEGNVESQIAAAVSAEAKLREDADKALDDRVKVIEGDLNTESTGLKARMTAAEADIDALEALVGDEEGTVSARIAAAVKAEEDRAKGVEGGLETRLKAVEDDYLTSADKTELTEAIATAKQEAIATVLGEGTDEDFDTLKEVADWILSDTTGAAALQTDVAAIKADYLKAADKTELAGNITTAQNAADKAQGEVDALEEVVATKAAQADLEALTGRVKTVEDDLNTATTGLKARMTTAEADIDAIEGRLGEGTVSEQIENAIQDANLGQYALASDLDTAEGKIEALEADTHTHANKAELDKIADGDVAKWNAKVDDVTAAADSGLKATRTGNTVAIEIDESVTWILDCGTSAV